MNGLIDGDQKIECFRDAYNAVHLQARSALGDVADGAIHYRGLAIENDLSRFERR